MARTNTQKEVIARLVQTTNWEEMDRAIMEGRAKLRQIAQDHQVSEPTMRKVLVYHYGIRIIFQRGRTGGIRFVNS